MISNTLMTMIKVMNNVKKSSSHPSSVICNNFSYKLLNLRHEKKGSNIQKYRIYNSISILWMSFLWPSIQFMCVYMDMDAVKKYKWYSVRKKSWERREPFQWCDMKYDRMFRKFVTTRMMMRRKNEKEKKENFWWWYIKLSLSRMKCC